jgi:hypothetical protein
MSPFLRASVIALVVLQSAAAAFADESRDPGLSDASDMNLRFHLATSAPATPGSVRLSLLSASGFADRAYVPGSATFGLRQTQWTPFPRGLQAYELSRADCALKGFGAGASLGLWLGALATTTGAWDDRTSWYLAGASAAAGALLGGTVGISSETWRTNYQWDE